MIVSLVYSQDAVSRLSLGSVRDLRNAAMWLCEAEAGAGTEGWSAITSRAKRWKDTGGREEDMDWVSFIFSPLSDEVLHLVSVYRCTEDPGSKYAKYVYVSPGSSSMGHEGWRSSSQPPVA